MKRSYFISILLTGIMVIAMTACGSVLASTTTEEVSNKNVIEAQNEPETENEIKIIGNAESDTASFTMTNKTGFDIVYVNIYDKNKAEEKTLEKKIQTELNALGLYDDKIDGNIGPNTIAGIEAYCNNNDIDFDINTIMANEDFLSHILGENYDGNMLKKEDVFENEETRTIYIHNEHSEGGDAEYIVAIMFKDSDDYNILHMFPVSDFVTVDLKVDNGTMYIEYTAENKDEVISTHDNEVAVAELLLQETSAPMSDYPSNTAYNESAGTTYTEPQAVYTESQTEYVEPQTEAPWCSIHGHDPVFDASTGYAYCRYCGITLQERNPEPFEIYTQPLAHDCAVDGHVFENGYCVYCGKCEPNEIEQFLIGLGEWDEISEYCATNGHTYIDGYDTCMICGAPR